jgi:hypothetical protein
MMRAAPSNLSGRASALNSCTDDPEQIHGSQAIVSSTMPADPKETLASGSFGVSLAIVK